MFRMPDKIPILLAMDAVEVPVVKPHVASSQEKAVAVAISQQQSQAAPWQQYAFQAPTFVTDGRGGFELIEETFWFPYREQVCR